MNKQFLVYFYQDGETTDEGETIKFKTGEVIRVTEQEMFKWLELAHNDKIKLCIYSASMVCDLS